MQLLVVPASQVNVLKMTKFLSTCIQFHPTNWTNNICHALPLPKDWGFYICPVHFEETFFKRDVTVGFAISSDIDSNNARLHSMTRGLRSHFQIRPPPI